LLPRHIPGVYLGSGILVKDQTVEALSTKKKVEEKCHQNKNPGAGAHLEQTNPLLRGASKKNGKII